MLFLEHYNMYLRNLVRNLKNYVIRIYKTRIGIRIDNIKLYNI